MRIEIDGKFYTVKVKETYMNQERELVDEILSLDEWTEIVRKKAISSLYHIEDVLSDAIGNPVRLSDDHPEIKKPILNLSGSISRLPKNLIIECDCED